MKVKQLITELLDMPMDAELVVSYENNSKEGYGYQKFFGPVHYEEVNQVGLLGVKE